MLRYKIAPTFLLSRPFGHSGEGRNPGVAGLVRSYNLVFTYPCQPGVPQPLWGHILKLNEAHEDANLTKPPGTGRMT